jgi:hypothetical protein
MTPYEEQMMAAAVVRQLKGKVRPPVTTESQVNKILPPGMMSQTAGAQGGPVDFSGQERQIASQRSYADMLRGKSAPKGKGVGPSNIYVAPNWGESLEYAVNQGMGGYLSGKANKADAGLDKSRAAEAARLEGIERGDTERKFGIQEDAATLQGERLALGISQADARAEASAASAAESERRYEEGAERSRLASAESERRYEEGVLKAERTAAAKRTKEINTDTIRLTKEITSEGVTQTRSKIDRFFKVIAPFEILDTEGAGTGEYNEIPGLGGFANSPGWTGSIATKVEDTFNGDETIKGSSGMNVRQAYFTVLNQQVKDISGGAVPVAEWIRNQAAAGASVWNKEMDAVTGMREIRRALEAKEATIFTGYDDDVVANYNKNRARGEAPAEAEMTEAEFLLLSPEDQDKVLGS